MAPGGFSEDPADKHDRHLASTDIAAVASEQLQKGCTPGLPKTLPAKLKTRFF
ncbi:MAG: hypothetical protein NTV57_06320 [Cyanobacteria bacterium]|nr:hypothetical protein [Cyanobacteriota bacterium]